MKKFSAILILMILVIGLVVNSSCSKKETTPNFILIMADDLGWGDTGFNGSTSGATPNLDRMASSGLVFNRFYSASPVCSPTRASCLTGRNPYRMGITTANTGHLPKQEVTLAELLKQYGYTTGLFGKWHLGTLTDQIHDANRGRPGDQTHLTVPTDHGFDQFFCTESKVPTWDPMRKPLYYSADSAESLRYGWFPRNNVQSEPYGTHYWIEKNKQATGDFTGDDTKLIMDQALQFIQQASSLDQSFLAVIWTHTPHLPVVAPEEITAGYPELDPQRKLYYGAIMNLDSQMGRLFGFLQEQNLDEQTCIFFCSDNGPEVRTPGSASVFRGRKRDLYEGGIRVPAFCLWPGTIEPGQQTDYPAFTSDYLPTIMEIIHGRIPEDIILDGNSFWSVTENVEQTRNKPMGFQYPGRFSLVTNEYKLVSYDLGQSYELYNLIEDIGEEHNLILQEPEITEQMKKDLSQWLESVDQDFKTLEQNEKN